MGYHTLDSIVFNIAKEAKWDMEKRWTGHSLRASAATRLFEKDIPETFIKDVTGHKSDKALREYARSETVKRKISHNIAQPATKAAKEIVSNDFYDQEEFESLVVEMERKSVVAPPKIFSGKFKKCTFNDTTNIN